MGTLGTLRPMLGAQGGVEEYMLASVEVQPARLVHRDEFGAKLVAAHLPQLWVILARGGCVYDMEDVGVWIGMLLGSCTTRTWSPSVTTARADTTY